MLPARLGAAVLALLVIIAATALACGSVVVPGDDGRDDDDGADGEDAGDGGDDGDGDDGVEPAACEPGGKPSYDQAWACLRDATCRTFDRCVAPIEREDCLRSSFGGFGEADVIRRERLREAVEKGTVIYRDDQVAACVSTIEEIACVSLSPVRTPFAVLCPIFAGTVPDGEACTTSEECATPGAACGGAACGEEELCCQGTCIPPANLLNPCVPETGCAPGLYCVDGTCGDGEAGAPCVSDDHCDLDHWCDAGTCQPDADAGGPCVANGQCPSPETCVGNDIAGSTGGTCGRSDRLGDTCDFAINCYGYVCEGPMEQLGVCVEPARDGDGCGEDDPCHSSFVCSAVTDGICMPRGGDGAPCSATAGQCRLGLFCDTETSGASSGACTLPRSSGGACNDDAQCASAICNEAAGLCEDFPGCYR